MTTLHQFGVLLICTTFLSGCMGNSEAPAEEDDATSEMGSETEPLPGSGYRKHGGATGDPWDGAPLVAVILMQLRADRDLDNVALEPTFINATYEWDEAAERVRIHGPFDPPTNETHFVALLSRNNDTSAVLGYTERCCGVNFYVHGQQEFQLNLLAPRGVHILAHPTERNRTIETDYSQGGSRPWSTSFYQKDGSMRMSFPDDDVHVEVRYLGIWPRENVTVMQT